jgi:hypothetical protein
MMAAASGAAALGPQDCLWAGSKPGARNCCAASAATHNPQELTVKVIVYADFNCVYCYPASQRADRLVWGREGGHRIGPDGAIHVGPDVLRCPAGTVGPAALSWRAAPELAAVRMGNHPDLPARGGDGRLGQGVHLLQPPPV